MKFAIVTNDVRFNKDNVFDGELKDLFWTSVKEEFNKLGHEIHTLDLYLSGNAADYYLFFAPEWKVANRLLKDGLGQKMVYLCAEPPTVVEQNTLEGLHFLSRIFPYILTSNHEWIDGEKIFIRNIPYVFSFSKNVVPFESRKLITGISANKRSDYVDELYTEREKAYCYFEKKYPDTFDFYGIGWNNANHPNYKGVVANKTDVFQKYKFALAFENTKGLSDYVSEKVYDCICSGIVPIYAGAPNIDDYLPTGSYIDYYKFKSLDDLADYIVNMDEDTYNSYIEAGKSILCSDLPQRLSLETFVHCILDAVEHENIFEVGASEVRWVKRKALEQEINMKKGLIKKKLFRKK